MQRRRGGRSCFGHGIRRAGHLLPYGGGSISPCPSRWPHTRPLLRGSLACHIQLGTSVVAPDGSDIRWTKGRRRSARPTAPHWSSEGHFSALRSHRVSEMPNGQLLSTLAGPCGCSWTPFGCLYTLAGKGRWGRREAPAAVVGHPQAPSELVEGVPKDSGWTCAPRARAVFRTPMGEAS